MTQRGFTLLELMVAMAIFALLAVTGWQVFDSVNRARTQAQYHADNLAALQYAYLQLQQDMAQIVPYQAPATATISNAATSNADDGQTPPVIIAPFMRLDNEQMSFVRFADPDPRYQTNVTVQRIEYLFANQSLIRRQYMSVQGAESISLDSILLKDVTMGRWQAYLPELSQAFPNNSGANLSAANESSSESESEVMLLPKGIGVSFTYQDNPVVWQWALMP